MCYFSMHNGYMYPSSFLSSSSSLSSDDDDDNDNNNVNDINISSFSASESLFFFFIFFSLRQPQRNRVQIHKHNDIHLIYLIIFYIGLDSLSLFFRRHSLDWIFFFFAVLCVLCITQCHTLVIRCAFSYHFSYVLCLRRSKQTSSTPSKYIEWAVNSISQFSFFFLVVDMPARSSNTRVNHWKMPI